MASHYARRTVEAQHGSRSGRTVFFGMKNDVAIAIILQIANKDTTALEIISCSGETGIFSISCAVHKAYVSDVIKYLESKNFTVRVEEEISCYSSRLLCKPLLS